MRFRKATEKDVAAAAEIYEEILNAQDRGDVFIGWERGVYPTSDTAMAAVKRGDLYVCELDGKVVATGVINQIQVDVYYDITWKNEAPDNEVTVLHTLTVSPSASGKGVGKAFVEFYEKTALKNNAPFLRIDTNEKNIVARAMYKKLGYSEPAIVPTTFNGIQGVNLVLLEKKL